jgi:hypothetical protein
MLRLAFTVAILVGATNAQAQSIDLYIQHDQIEKIQRDQEQIKRDMEYQKDQLRFQQIEMEEQLNLQRRQMENRKWNDFYGVRQR